MKTILLIMLSWLVLFSAAISAEAYIPQSDTEILERITVTSGDKQRLKAIRTALINQPGDYTNAYKLAQDYITLAKNQSDPRYYGYAEAVLQPWLQGQFVEADALVLKAVVLQNRHDFTGAISYLNRAININPRLSQAWLILAAIHEVQGDYASALRSCLALAKVGNPLTANSCTQSALSLSGQAQASYQQLAATVGEQGSAEELTWAYTVLAEMAERLGLMNEADSWYRKALAQHDRSVYLLTCYADFLLDQNKPTQVVDLLMNETQADALLLRLTLAEQQLGSRELIAHVKLINGRIAAAQARGDSVHQGDEARFNLHVLKDATTALKLASSNWQVQKEPRDARILLEAALAAKQPEAAEPVIQFLQQTRLEDGRLKPFINSLKG